MSKKVKDAVRSSNATQNQKKANSNNAGSNPNRQKKTPTNHAPYPTISPLKSGKIKWFDLHKGVGYIHGDDGEDIFVHFSKIALGRQYTGFEKNDRVTYRSGIDPTGQRIHAINVTLEFDDRGKPINEPDDNQNDTQAPVTEKKAGTDEAPVKVEVAPKNEDPDTVTVYHDED